MEQLFYWLTELLYPAEQQHTSAHNRQTSYKAGLVAKFNLVSGSSIQNCLPLSTGTACTGGTRQYRVFFLTSQVCLVADCVVGCPDHTKTTTGRGWQLAVISGSSLSLLPLNCLTKNHNFLPEKSDTSTNREWLQQCLNNLCEFNVAESY